MDDNRKAIHSSVCETLASNFGETLIVQTVTSIHGGRVANRKQLVGSIRPLTSRQPTLSTQPNLSPLAPDQAGFFGRNKSGNNKTDRSNPFYHSLQKLPEIN